MTGRIVRERFKEHGLQVSVDENLSTNYLETLKALVEIGTAWSVLPHTMVDDRLAIVTVDSSPMTRELVCIRHRNRTLSRAAQSFLEQLIQGQETQNWAVKT